MHGIRDIALLESAVMRPQTGYYQDAVEEAAALMKTLCNKHPFHDGNKRASFAAADTVLFANGYEIVVDPLAAHQFIIDSFSNKEFRFDQIRDCLRSLLKPLVL